jgi:hypothetical protein
MTLFRRGAPLFVQALGLVIVTLVAAQLISIAVIFTLPPPPPEFYRTTEIVRALKSGQPVQPRDGRLLVVKQRSSSAPWVRTPRAASTSRPASPAPSRCRPTASSCRSTTAPASSSAARR